jgi:hypothetical protein
VERGEGRHQGRVGGPSPALCVAASPRNKVGGEGKASTPGAVILLWSNAPLCVLKQPIPEGRQAPCALSCFDWMLTSVFQATAVACGSVKSTVGRSSRVVGSR